jgi:hypothetical protein
MLLALPSMSLVMKILFLVIMMILFQVNFAKILIL